MVCAGQSDGTCPNIFDSVKPFQPYIITFVVYLCMLIFSIGCFVRNMRLRVCPFCFSNNFIMAAIAYFALMCITLTAPLPKAPVSVQFFFCRTFPIFIIFAATVVLLAYLERFCVLVRATTSVARQGAVVRRWVIATVIIFLVYIAICVVMQFTYSSSKKFDTWVLPFYWTDFGVHLTLTVVLTVFSVRSFRLLRGIALHPSTVAVVRRIERALAVILAVCYFRALWIVLTLTGVNPIMDAIQGGFFWYYFTMSLYGILTQALPLGAGLYAVIPANEERAPRPPRPPRMSAGASWLRAGRSASTIGLLDG